MILNPNDYLYAFAYKNNIAEQRVVDYLNEHELGEDRSDAWRSLIINDPDNVYRVYTLNPTGPGSILDALDYTGTATRHVIFDVSGTIKLTEKWARKVKNVIVHGDTSPGGICITGAPMAFVDCENLVFEHVMWCLDTAPTKQLSKVWNPIKVISLDETCRNVTFNHCSVFGGDDENNFGPSNHYDRNVDVANEGITVTNCIFGFGTRYWRGNHNFSLAVSFGRDMTIANNLFVHNNRRSPQVYCPPGDCDEGGVIAGNVVVNHGSMAVGVIRGTFDVYNNTFIQGRNSKPKANFKPIKTTGTFQADDEYSVLYIRNNHMFNRKRRHVGTDMQIFGHENKIPYVIKNRAAWGMVPTKSADATITSAGTKFNHALEQKCRWDARRDGQPWITTMADIGGVPELEQHVHTAPYPAGV